MRKLVKWIVILVSMVSLTGGGFAAVINVPAAQPTLQAGINAASTGDTVLVANGTYTGAGNFDVDFMGKAITVQSAGGMNLCVIECNSEGRGFLFDSGEGSTSILEGFTIRNGWRLDNGGALSIIGSSPLIRDCTFTTCYARNQGGGAIYCYDGAAPTITGCKFIANSTDLLGAAINCESNCTLTIDNCLFQNNQTLNANAYGGAIRCQTSCPSTIINSSFITNTTRFGTIFCRYDSAPFLGNCLFSGNVAPEVFTGAIHCAYSCAPTLLNCTLANNTASGNGGGIYCRDYSAPNLKNCILWGNTPLQIFVGGTSVPTVVYSDIQGGWSGTGNLDSNPLFVAGPLGSFYLSQIAAGQSANSPCLNGGQDLAANTCYPTTSGPYCLNGLTTRTDHYPDGGAVDMGFHVIPSGFATPTPTPWQPPVPATTPGSISVLVLLISGLLVVGRFRK